MVSTALASKQLHGITGWHVVGPALQLCTGQRGCAQSAVLDARTVDGDGGLATQNSTGLAAYYHIDWVCQHGA